MIGLIYGPAGSFSSRRRRLLYRVATRRDIDPIRVVFVETLAFCGVPHIYPCAESHFLISCFSVCLLSLSSTSILADRATANILAARAANTKKSLFRRAIRPSRPATSRPAARRPPTPLIGNAGARRRPRCKPPAYLESPPPRYGHRGAETSPSCPGTPCRR